MPATHAGQKLQLKGSRPSWPSLGAGIKALPSRTLCQSGTLITIADKPPTHQGFRAHGESHLGMNYRQEKG